MNIHNLKVTRFLYTQIIELILIYKEIAVLICHLKLKALSKWQTYSHNKNTRISNQILTLPFSSHSKNKQTLN